MSRVLSRYPRARRGVALAIALAAIVLIGALIAGAFFSSTQEFRVGRNSLTEVRATSAAEYGLQKTMAAWDTNWQNSAAIGAQRTLNYTISDGSSAQVVVTKTDPITYWLVSSGSTGSAPRTDAQHRLGHILHVEIPDFHMMGAITARGRDTVNGNGSISGNDAPPASWNDCPPAGAPAAGMVVNDSATNAFIGNNCKSGTTVTCITGSPKIKDSTALVGDTMTYTKFGGWNYDSLTKLATASKTFITGGTLNQMKPSVTVTGACNYADTKNWGDTAHVAAGMTPGPCQSYYPVVWLKGAANNWVLAQGGGQGIILVDGNLLMNGSFVWTGPIIVRGTVSTAGTGNKVFGGIMAMNRNGGYNTFKGNAIVQFSRCAINMITARYSEVKPMRYRAWAEMF